MRAFAGKRKPAQGRESTSSAGLGRGFCRAPIEVETRPTFGTLEDPNEQEADRVADLVMRSPGSQLARGCDCGGQCSDCRTEPPERVQRLVAATSVQKNRGGGAGAPPIVHAVVRAPGQRLDPKTRAFMEPRFGHDFGHVRIHADGEAAESARAVHARAYTMGRDLVFGAGQYAPETREGKRLLAHELTHVIQQARERLLLGRLQRQNNAGQAATVLGSGEIAGVQFHPAAVAGTRVGPVGGPVGLRLSVVIGRGTTLRDMARLLLPLWNTATPFTPPQAGAPLPLVPLTTDELARGLWVYNQFLPVAARTRWEVGLRFPLPIRIDQSTNEGVLHPDLIRRLAASFDPADEPLLDRYPTVPTAPERAGLQQSVERFLSAVPTTSGRGIHLAARAIANPLTEREFVLGVFDELGAGAFGVALSMADNFVNREVAQLASQRAGADILDRLRAILAAAPADLSEEQQSSLSRNQALLGRVVGVAPREAPYVLPDAGRPLNLDRQTDVTLFAMNLWAEAWTEVARFGRQSLEAVAQIVLNRVACGFAGTPRAVILAPLQFSWTRPASPVFPRAFEPVRNSNEPVWLQCIDVATEALSGALMNPGVDNADHYFNPAAAAPDWEDPARLVATIGNHRFYRLRCPPP